MAWLPNYESQDHDCPCQLNIDMTARVRISLQIRHLGWKRRVGEKNHESSIGEVSVAGCAWDVVEGRQVLVTAKVLTNMNEAKTLVLWACSKALGARIFFQGNRHFGWLTAQPPKT